MKNFMINSVKIPSGTVAEIRMNSRWSSEGFFGGNLKGFPEELQKKIMLNSEEILREPPKNSCGNSEGFAGGAAE